MVRKEFFEPSVMVLTPTQSKLSPEVFDKIDACIELSNAKNVIIDFVFTEDVCSPFPGGSPLAKLVALNYKTQADEKRLILANIAPSSLEVLRLMRLHQVFEIKPDRASSLKIIRRSFERANLMKWPKYILKNLAIFAFGLKLHHEFCPDCEGVGRKNGDWCERCQGLREVWSHEIDKTISNENLTLADIPPDDAPLEDILEFGQTFHAYRETDSPELCWLIAREKRDSTLSELRICLFVEQRLGRGKLPPEEKEWEVYIRKIVSKIRVIVFARQ